MPIAAMARPRAMRADAFTAFVREDVIANAPKTGVECGAAARYRGRATLLYDEKCSVYRRKRRVAGRLESSTAASRSNDRIQVIEVLLQRTSAGRGQPVISPRCAACKRFV